MPASTSKAGIARKRVRLTSEHIKKALSMVAGGKVPGAGVEWADEGCPGLALRVTPRAATWYLRLRSNTVRIGTADQLTVPAAREAATRARLEVKDGRDPELGLKVFQHAMAKTGDMETAADASWPEEAEVMTDAERRRRGPWQWGDLIHEFLAWKQPRLEEDYYPLYAKYLQHPAFDRIARKLVRDVTIEDLEEVRDDIIEANTLSAAKRSVQQGKEALSWAWRSHAKRSGLGKVQYEWWARWTVDYQAGTKDHTPTLEELARTLVLAERHRTLGATEHATSPGTLAMLWAVVLTAQRTYALSRTKASALVPMDGRDGWWVLGWEGTIMKSRFPHGLPLPPAAQEVLAEILDENRRKGRTPSDWLFPSIRGDGPASPNSVNQLLNRLCGIHNGGKEPDGRDDILARHGIRRWTPHDVRRSLSSFLGDRRLGGAASAILDHSHDKKADERERTAPVTRLHYDRGQKMDLKAEGMELWVQAIMDAYAREKETLDAAPLPEPRILRRASA